ncbi:NAD(P)/FAD-dependent oxidoreductase [Aspergillus novofumigatus IBT 16806]|uniref:Putative cytoplasmic thioredoxin reductase n=1 Tax=Aspergillus novofumigatus (strain IBT 16806) TaxID=1392255 RepID=A0A2I1CB29_ASPN1|nr:putative cytoplasmic thioredoxin reductase [Aspergillus novofumigatus IBT 16806]PKX94833.1 putative cytoplasmic thioredoxin reductase [Aspergillus novofumigatus IBT 16806]
MFVFGCRALFALFTFLTVCLGQANQTQYDVIVIGGGPSGLSAASGLSRVLRKVILFDSGKYRNNPTRHMHDVIGNDHVVPTAFRAAARKQISFYNVTTFVDQEVTKIQLTNNSFSATVTNGTTFTARKVILGSGLKDDLPNVPGLRDAFGKGIFWCPWCDGFEHRDQPIGVLGNLSDAYDSAKELYPTLNKDIRVYSNGTNNTAQQTRIASKDQNWEKVFKAYNITIINKPILNITRVQNGSIVQDEAIRKEFDKFRVYFTDGTFEERGAFITNYATSQASELPKQLGVGFLGNKMNTTARGLRTTVKGVWGIGDANSDNSTNVPHAMSSGKTAAVHCHVELATEELARTSGASPKRDLINDGLAHERVEQQMGNEIEDIYNRLRRR